MPKESDKQFIRYCRENKTILSPEYIEGEGWFLGNNTRCASLPSAYFVSANILVETGLSDDCENFIVAPALYLYRHAVELALKELLSDLEVHDSQHSIRKLYYQLEEKLRQRNTNLLPDEDVFKAIMQFDSISTSSTELRYDNQKDKNFSLLGGNHLVFGNLKNAQYHANRIIEYYKQTKISIQKQVKEQV